MTTRESIAKSIFNEMAKDSAGAKKLYWETAPREVKDYCFRLADVSIQQMVDCLRLKEMDGTATLAELSELDQISAELEKE